MNTPRIAGWLSPLLACLVLSGCTQEAQQAEATAQEGTTATEEDAPADIEYLFVQTADGVMLENGVLRLMGVSPSTLFFSDRPERVTGHTPTAYFVAHWASGTDGQSFADVPPNAALSILEAGEVEDLVLVLMSPRLENGDLVYDVEILEGPDNVSGQACALFIDVIGRPMSPGSVAGVHRRHRRRARRGVIH